MFWFPEGIVFSGPARIQTTCRRNQSLHLLDNEDGSSGTAHPGQSPPEKPFGSGLCPAEVNQNHTFSSNESSELLPIWGGDRPRHWALGAGTENFWGKPEEKVNGQGRAAIVVLPCRAARRAGGHFSFAQLGHSRGKSYTAGQAVSTLAF